MLLTVDIGNTNINFGIFRGQRLIRKFFLSTKRYHLKVLKNLLNDSGIDSAIVCSVVPNVSKIVEADLKRLLTKRVDVIGRNTKVPIKNLYRNPKQVGQDRLINAYAGIIFYGAPLIVVDFGTAITFDVISKNKEYLGGMILPGLGISLDALAERTALLPKINLEKPREFIGHDTKGSMLSGIVYGFAALADDLTKRIKNKIGKNAEVIGTGGNIEFITKYCKNLDAIDKDLTLKGLNLVYQAKYCTL